MISLTVRTRGPGQRLQSQIVKFPRLDYITSTDLSISQIIDLSYSLLKEVHGTSEARVGIGRGAARERTRQARALITVVAGGIVLHTAELKREGA